MLVLIVIFVAITLTSASPLDDQVIFKLDSGPRYQYVVDDEGVTRLADLWVKKADLDAAWRYDPDTDNRYHLFTRSNPTVSQPLLPNRPDLLSASNYDPSKKTVVMVHGWRSTPASAFNTVLVPAFLGAADVNVIMLDWSAGAGTDNYPLAVVNTIRNGGGIARFITWLNTASGSTLAQYHLVGFSLGGHAVGVIGRNLGGQVPYITSLDPAGPGFYTNTFRFSADDGIYTEVIHSNSGEQGFLPTLGKVDFYPNGGVRMPGCDSSRCNHHRAFYYFAESLTSTFTGRRCASFLAAIRRNCDLPETTLMGGLEPKTRQTGVYYVETNPAPPFSQG